MSASLVTLAIPIVAVALASAAGPPSPAPSPSPIAIASQSPSPSPTADYDEPPKVVKLTRPVYPKGPFREGVQGTVLIEFLVDETGSVRNPTVKESVPGLDAAALDCVRQWRFNPARKGGAPVATLAQAPVTFRITEKKKKK